MTGDRMTGMAGLLMFLFLGTVGRAQPHAFVGAAVQYSCGRQDILIERDRSSARVTFQKRSYLLSRKPSDIGEKYLSSAAALIIDGRSAVFVTDEVTDLGKCIEADPMASAH